MMPQKVPCGIDLAELARSGPSDDDIGGHAAAGEISSGVCVNGGRAFAADRVPSDRGTRPRSRQDDSPPRDPCDRIVLNLIPGRTVERDPDLSAENAVSGDGVVGRACTYQE